MAELQPFDHTEFHLFPRIQAVGAWIGRHLSIFPDGSETCLSEHRGAAAMLDSHLDQPQLQFEKRPDADL